MLVYLDKTSSVCMNQLSPTAGFQHSSAGSITVLPCVHICFGRVSPTVWAGYLAWFSAERHFFKQLQWEFK